MNMPWAETLPNVALTCVGVTSFPPQPLYQLWGGFLLFIQKKCSHSCIDQPKKKVKFEISHF